jgi:hypothetical protein
MHVTRQVAVVLLARVPIKSARHPNQPFLDDLLRQKTIRQSEFIVIHIIVCTTP